MKSCVTKVTFHFNRAFEPPNGRAVGDPAAVLPWCHSRSFTAGAIARCLRAMLTLAPSDGERDNYCGAAHPSRCRVGIRRAVGAEQKLTCTCV
jgi:hypothetical protein